MGFHRFLFLALLVSSSMVITARAGAEWSVELCAEECMPICMRVSNARVRACKTGCTHGCEQLQGKGLNLIVNAE